MFKVNIFWDSCEQFNENWFSEELPRKCVNFSRKSENIFTSNLNVKNLAFHFRCMKKWTWIHFRIERFWTQFSLNQRSESGFLGYFRQFWKYSEFWIQRDQTEVGCPIFQMSQIEIPTEIVHPFWITGQWMTGLASKIVYENHMESGRHGASAAIKFEACWSQG